jgi:hypothetical protein
MATFSRKQMLNAGTPGQALTAGVTYTFELQNLERVPIDPPKDMTLTTQWGNYGTSYLVLDGTGLATQQVGGVVTLVGSLKPGQAIPLSNAPISCDINQTATIYVEGDLQGDRAVLSFTSTGWDGVNGSGTGKITEAIVTSISGSNFISGDGITVPRGTPGIQGLGFTNADKPAIMDLFPDKINCTFPNSTTITGSFGGFLNLINEPSLTIGSTGFAISMLNSGSAGGAFEFTPTVDITANSYAIRSTGNFDLDIAP